MNKKKNGTDQLHLKFFVLIGAVLVLPLLSGCLLFSMLSAGSEAEEPFNQTATSIVATNDHVATLISQTQVAATEQFVMTSTARP